jgi:hypothetical protein
MKNSNFLLVLIMLLTIQPGQAQNKAIDLHDYSFSVNSLEDDRLTELLKVELQNSRFVFVGEQHGIKSAATVTARIYELGKANGYNVLCVETDDLVAQKLKSMAASGNFTEDMRAHYKAFAFSIPFYNNEDDHVLFDQVQADNGAFWGIDQTFVVQFRYNFHLLANEGSNAKIRKLAAQLKVKADAAFDKAVETKDPSAPYIFQYDEATHQELMAVAGNEKEKELIRQMMKTKEIYQYYFQGKGYQNNEVRGRLMKSNFMRYWNEAVGQGKDPKVIFKLGANHAARGLTSTNIYDIANLGSELAISRGEHSVHVAVLGLKGKAATGNPFAPSPVVDFDNTEQLPEEVRQLVAGMTDKYFVMNLAPVRDFAYGKGFSEKFKEKLFQYDVLILVNGAEAVRSF